MGLFSGFFERRRRRESAVPTGNELTSEPPPAEAVKPVGQPVEGVGSPLGASGAGQVTDLGSVFGMLGMIKDAYASGSIQVSQGDSHVVDLRGTADADELREQIMAAMSQRGIDPEATPEGTQIDASQYAGLQEDLLQVLRDNGIDVGAPGAPLVQPDSDGDGQSG
jgi:hypothetical protein